MGNGTTLRSRVTVADLHDELADSDQRLDPPFTPASPEALARWVRGAARERVRRDALRKELEAALRREATQATKGALSSSG